MGGNVSSHPIPHLVGLSIGNGLNSCQKVFKWWDRMGYLYLKVYGCHKQVMLIICLVILYWIAVANELYHWGKTMSILALSVIFPWASSWFRLNAIVDEPSASSRLMYSGSRTLGSWTKLTLVCWKKRCSNTFCKKSSNAANIFFPFGLALMKKSCWLVHIYFHISCSSEQPILVGGRRPFYLYCLFLNSLNHYLDS